MRIVGFLPILFATLYFLDNDRQRKVVVETHEQAFVLIKQEVLAKHMELR